MAVHAPAASVPGELGGLGGAGQGGGGEGEEEGEGTCRNWPGPWFGREDREEANLVPGEFNTPKDI